MEESASSAMAAKPSFDQLRIQIGSSSEIDFRRLTNKWVLNQGSDENQLSGILNIFEQAGLHAEGLNDVVMEAWGMLIDGKIWKAKFESKDDAIKAIDTPFLKDFRARAQSSRNRKERYIAIIKAEWGTSVQDWRFEVLGENYLGNVASVAGDCTFELASDMIRKITVNRLQKTQSGRGSTRSIITKDWADIRSLDENEVKLLLSREPISDHELIRFEHSSIQLFRGQASTVEGINLDVESGDIDDDDIVMNSENENAGIPDFEQDESDMGSTESRNTDEVDHADDGDEEVESEIRTTIRRKAKHSGCACRGIESSLLERLRRKNAGTSGLKTETQCIAALRRIIECNSNGTTLKHVCHRHLHALAGHFGLQVQKLTSNGLRARLKACWNHRDDLNAFKTSPDHTSWFRLKSRPQVEDDLHGVYAKRPVRKSIACQPSVRQAEIIVEEIGGPGAWVDWQKNGNLLVQEMFLWLWDGITSDGQHEKGIGDMIIEEFDMYLHHQRQRNGQSNKGWLRTMFYSLSQQIVRQDIEYWALYVCLRPDRNIRLVSYPYYAKYVTPGDPTYFRHIDMNIDKYLANGHGGNIIQGSLSLDNESPEGCTEIVPSFHEHIEGWWSKVKARGMATSGHIHGLEKIWLKEDAAEYGDFVPVPCQRGGVRVTRPEILHGSTHNNGGTKRRTILPWFVAVSQDGQTLDNEESDKWGDIARAHATQEAINLTPSGLANRFGPIPYRFPPSTQLYLASPISQALVCRTTWDDPVVQAQANIVLGMDRERARRAINRHRLEALRAFKAVYDMMKTAEGLFYGVDSFFNQRAGK
jgi:hypothetical protein